MNKKKSLKKIVALAANLVLTLVIALFAGCSLFGSKEKEEYNLDNAKSYVDSLYKSAATETGADFERVGKVKIEGVDYEIVWTVDVNSGVTVTQKDSGDYLIDIDENAENDVAYVLTGTIKAPNGETITVTYNHTVPKFKELTWAQFTNTEDEKAVVIKGIISSIIHNSKGWYEIYLQDNDGGYYVYKLDEAKGADLKAGQEIRVRGEKDTYYGVHQVINASVEVINATETPVAPTDITAIANAASDFKAEELLAKQSMLVTIKDVTVLGQNAGDSTYFDFKLGNKTSYVRISSSVCALSTEDQTAFKNAVKDNIGKNADVTGVVSIYNGKLYLIPLTKDAFTNFKLIERNEADQIAFEKDLMNALPSEITETFTLQTKGKLYENVAIAWASSNENVAKVNNGKLEVTLPADAPTTVTLTATLTCGSAQAVTVTFADIPVIQDPPVLADMVRTAPVSGETYKIFVAQNNLNKTLYLTGEMDGNYFASSALPTSAADVVVTEVDGKYTISVDGSYICVTTTTKSDGKLSHAVSYIRFADQATKFVWDETYATFVTVNDANEKVAYVGTYNSFATFSASNYSYISTSFPMHLCKLISKTEATDAEKASYEKSNLTLDTTTLGIADTTTVELPTTNAFFNDVTIAWSTESTIASVDNNVLTVNKPDANTTITLVATITVGETSVTKEFTVAVVKLSSIPEIMAAADGTDVVFVGTVVEIKDAWNTQYNNMSVWVADADGNRIQVYRLGTQVALYDEVTITGKVGSYNEVKQIAQGGTAEITKKHVCETYTTATCTAPAKCTVCGVANGSALEHFDGDDADTICDTCDLDLAVQTTKESFAIAANAGTLAADSLSISWASDNFTFVAEKGTNNNAIRTTDSDHFRIYQGNIFTISAKNNQKIVKIVVTCNDASYATVLVNSLASVSGASAVAEGAVVTITFTGDATSLQFTTTAQTRVKNFDIYYA